MLTLLQSILPTGAPSDLLSQAAEKDFTTHLLTFILIVIIAGIVGGALWAWKYAKWRQETEKERKATEASALSARFEREDEIRRQEKEENKQTTELLSKIHLDLAVIGQKLISIENRVSELEKKVN